ncbi:MAG: TIGR04086 family membrane protein [Oscillospiraceae bacterium]|jgi:putative membrane protein (TIGR04086 family)
MEQKGVERIARPILISVAAGAIVCIGILLLLSVLLSVKSIPQSLISPMAIFAIIAGAFVSGFTCARAQRQNGLAYGVACGAVLSILVLLAGIGLPGNDMGMLALFKVVFMLFGGMLGGVLGVNVRQRRRR